MGVGRSQHVGGIEVARDQSLFGRADRSRTRQQARQRFGGAAAWIDHGHHGDLRHLAKHLGVDAGDVPGPN